jgi:hypothetical protein
VARARYEVRQGRATVLAATAAGALTGRAPLFERFTLGDTATLRGWNRYDIAPIGGARMIHQTIELRYAPAALFLDAGSVWESGAKAKARYSTGVHELKNSLTPIRLTVEEMLARQPPSDRAFMQQAVQMRYGWPGNIRELRNVVERMAILTPGPAITAAAVPSEIRASRPSGGGLHDVRDAAERRRIVEALEQTRWNVAGAARLLGIERTALHKRMRALGVQRSSPW